MIDVKDYFGDKPHSEEQANSAVVLLGRVNSLLDEARGSGAYADAVDPDTGTNISGSKGGSGDGGFRLQSSPTGAPNSAHKEAKAVDVFDPDGSLDTWITDACLSRHGLYREAPESTVGWCHLQSKSPRSGHRTFIP